MYTQVCSRILKRMRNEEKMGCLYRPRACAKSIERSTSLFPHKLNSKVPVACHLNFGFLVVQDVTFCFFLNLINWCTLLFIRSYVMFWNFSNLKDPREASNFWASISNFFMIWASVKKRLVYRWTNYFLHTIEECRRMCVST